MKRNRIHRICYYQPNDSRAIAAYCQKKARQGWLLEKINSGGLMTFRSIEPRQLTFAVAYFPSASVFDPQQSAGQQTYIDYCKAAGWEYAAANGPMQIFYSDSPNPIPIETDESYKLTSIRKSMRKTTVFSYFMLLICMSLNLSSYITRLFSSPIEFLSSTANLLSVVSICAICLLLIWQLIDHGLWCRRSKRAVEAGGECLNPNTRTHLAASAMILMFAFTMLFSIIHESLDLGRQGFIIYVLLWTAVTYAAVFSILFLLKKTAKTKQAVKAGFVAAAVIISILMTAAVTRTALQTIRSPSPRADYTYTDSYGLQWDIFSHSLPLTMENLGFDVTPQDVCSYHKATQSSPFVTLTEYSQQVYNNDSLLPNLSYSIADVGWQPLFKILQSRAVQPRTVRHAGQTITLYEYHTIDPQPWGALQAYQVYQGRQYYHQYRLIYSGRIVTLSIDDISPGQLSTLQAYAAANWQ